MLTPIVMCDQLRNAPRLNGVINNPKRPTATSRSTLRTSSGALLCAKHDAARQRPVAAAQNPNTSNTTVRW